MQYLTPDLTSSKQGEKKKKVQPDENSHGLVDIDRRRMLDNLKGAPPGIFWGSLRPT